MKYKYLFPLFILICDCVSAQSTFEYLDQFEEGVSVITSPREHSNGNIYIAYSHGINNIEKNTYGGVRILSPEGQLVNDLQLQTEDIDGQVLKIELFEEKDRIVIFSSQSSNNNPQKSINIKAVDPNLSILSDTTLVVDTLYEISQISTSINSQGNIVAVATNLNRLDGQALVNYFMEVTAEGQVTKFSQLPQEVSEHSYYNIIEHQNGYACLGFYPLLINDSLNHFERIELERKYARSNAIDIVPWENNKYLVANYEGSGLNGHDYSLSILDSNLLIQDSVMHDDPFGEANFLGVFGVLDYEHPHTIYTGGYEVPRFIYIWLVQHNEDLSRNWLKFYYDEGFNAVYTVFGVVASKDGGVMVCGRKNLTGFLYKLDSNGELVTSTTDTAPLISSITVYPNPSEGLFRVKIDSKSNQEHHLVMYDSKGREVLRSESLYNGDHSYDLSHLQAGQYHYQLTSDKLMRGSGSWVKM